MAKVLFKRIQSSTGINDVPVQDGSVIISGDGKMFIDYDTDRHPVGGTLDDEMDDDSTNGVENNVIKKYIDEAINDYKGTVLWTNSSPTSAFIGQTITLDSGDYNTLIVLYYDFVQVSADKRLLSIIIPKLANGEKSVLESVFRGTTGDMYVASRTMLFDSATSITFGNNMGKAIPSSGTENVNTVNVPYMIIGYKASLY